MSLDWEQFREIVDYKDQENFKDAQLLDISNKQSFLIEFLTQLLQELKKMRTTSEIVDKYPLAGSLLTKAATHPYFGCTITLAQLLVDSLLHYSKLDLSSKNEDLSMHNNRSVIWCIVRLRRFINVSQHQSREIKRTQTMVRKISELLDVKADRLEPQRITKLTNMCLTLAHSRDACHIIEKLVNCALVEPVSNIHFDGAPPLLSGEFISQLVNNDTQQPITLRTQYLSWPNELKQRIYLHYDEVLEYEVLELIEWFITNITQQNYIPMDTLEAQLKQTNLIQSLQNLPVLGQRALYHLSNYVIRYEHWKLVRLSQCLTHCLNYPFAEDFKLFIENVNFDHLDAQGLYEIVMNYIYEDSSLKDIQRRRNEAWCLALSFNRFTWYCVYHIIQWCREDKSWSQQMEQTLAYLNWLIYPSLDNRESESLLTLRQWVQTSCRNIGLCNEFHKQWPELLNYNAVLIVCFITSIFFSNDHLHADQQISLVQGVLFQKSNFHGTTKNENDPDTALAYLFLDYLNDMESNADSYPSPTFDVKYIKNYILNNICP